MAWHSFLQLIAFNWSMMLPESSDDEGGFRGDPHPRAESKTRCKHQEGPIFWAPDDNDDDGNDDEEEEEDDEDDEEGEDDFVAIIRKVQYFEHLMMMIISIYFLHRC